jgi:heme-degrading monooxygenase HmoA
MFARVSIFKGEPGDAGDQTQMVREKVLPAARKLEGFAGMLALADPSTGKSMGITFWQTEEALKASEEAADRMRNESAVETGDQTRSLVSSGTRSPSTRGDDVDRRSLDRCST